LARFFGAKKCSEIVVSDSFRSLLRICRIFEKWKKLGALSLDKNARHLLMVDDRKSVARSSF